VGFIKQAPKWGATGIEPPESKRNIGWEVEDRPPAAWLNWFMNLTAESLQELQSKAAEKTFVEDKIAEGIAAINVDIPDASLTVKGITQLNSAVNSTSETEAATPKAVKRVNDSVAEHLADYTLQIPYAVANGTANTYVISTSITSLVAGMAVSVKINAASTGASTLNWDGKGAKGLKKSDGTNITNLKANGVYTFRYDGVNFILQGEGGEYGTATKADVLNTKTIGTEEGIVTGTMPDYSMYPKGAALSDYIAPNSFRADGAGHLVIEPRTGFYKVGLNSSGFGAMIISDANLIPEYIRSDKPILGLQGTMASIGAHTLATSAGRWPNNDLAVYMPAGWYGNGINGGSEVQVTGAQVQNAFPSLAPRNIRLNENIMGMIGTLIEGKKFATGSTIPSGSSIATDFYTPGNGIYKYPITVTGLSFTPTIVLVITDFSRSQYVNFSFKHPLLNGWISGQATTKINGSSSADMTVLDATYRLFLGGFCAPMAGGGWASDWIAIE